MNRREALAGVAAAGLLFTAAPALAKKRPHSALLDHDVLPLPFKPGALKGLSAKLIESHHAKNYAGAVRKLGEARAAIKALPLDAPGFVLGGLRSKELAFRNSVVMHELYFGNLVGPDKPSGAALTGITKSFGSIAAFESQLARAAMTQAGGSGWTTLIFDLVTGRLELTTGADHKEAAALSLPILVLDMYEHSYAIDYGADAKSYVEAFYANVNWQVVNRRLEDAQRVKLS